MRSVLTGTLGFLSGSSSKTGNSNAAGRLIIGSPIKNLRIVVTNAAAIEPAALTYCENKYELSFNCLLLRSDQSNPEVLEKVI